MQIVNINGLTALCTAKGVNRSVSLFLLQDTPLVEGDYVMVHVGYALERISLEDAQVTWALLDDMVSADA
tara:strand:+ start:18195 stop:18404 length:210 start_codon:yes stop_codon:yes gene_type:complete